MSTGEPIEDVLDEIEDDIVWINEYEAIKHGDGYVLSICSPAVRNFDIDEDSVFRVGINKEEKRIVAELLDDVDAGDPE